MSTLQITERQGAEWITLDRPDVLNCLNREMIDELTDYFGALEQRDEIRIVVVRGSGENFCAGLDLREFSHEQLPDDVEEALKVQRKLSRLILKMRSCPQPIVCMLHGVASGGGLALALASDIRIAATDVRMNAAFIRVGLTGCDVGVSYFLPRLVGASVASELLMTGRFIDGERALSTGLVSELHPLDELEAATTRIVDEILSSSPLALRLTKEALNVNGGPVTLDAAVAIEDRQQVLAVASGEFSARVSAFLNKD